MSDSSYYSTDDEQAPAAAPPSETPTEVLAQRPCPAPTDPDSVGLPVYSPGAEPSIHPTAAAHPTTLAFTPTSVVSDHPRSGEVPPPPANVIQASKTRRGKASKLRASEARRCKFASIVATANPKQPACPPTHRPGPPGSSTDALPAPVPHEPTFPPPGQLPVVPSKPVSAVGPVYHRICNDAVGVHDPRTRPHKARPCAPPGPPPQAQRTSPSPSPASFLAGVEALEQLLINDVRVLAAVAAGPKPPPTAPSARAFEEAAATKAAATKAAAKAAGKAEAFQRRRGPRNRGPRNRGPRNQRRAETKPPMGVPPMVPPKAYINQRLDQMQFTIEQIAGRQQLAAATPKPAPPSYPPPMLVQTSPPPRADSTPTRVPSPTEAERTPPRRTRRRSEHSSRRRRRSASQRSSRRRRRSGATPRRRRHDTSTPRRRSAQAPPDDHTARALIAALLQQITQPQQHRPASRSRSHSRRPRRADRRSDSRRRRR